MRRISGLLIGLVAGYVVPGIVLGALFALFEVRQPDGSGEMPLWFSQLPLFFLAAMPVLAGFLAARIARVQPLLNGLMVGALGGSVMFMFSQALPFVGLAMWALHALGGLFGAWLQKKVYSGAVAL